MPRPAKLPDLSDVDITELKLMILAVLERHGMGPDAECTAECRPEPQREIRTPSNTDTSLQGPSRGVGRSQRWCAK
jgi:hypothetical protein